jgi:hypothetical protein
MDMISLSLKIPGKAEKEVYEKIWFRNYMICSPDF